MQRPTWTRLDRVLVAALGLTALLTRGLLRTPGLTSLDSGILATGVVDYDFASFRPHPPYYPLTVGLGKLAALAVGPVQALSWVSVLASAVLVLATYAVARHFLGSTVSAGAAMLVLASPLALSNGSAPLSYSLEGASSAVLALAALRARIRPSPLAWSLLGLAGSVAVGIRPSSLVLFAPLVLWGAGRSVRPHAWTAGSGAAASLMWGVPALVAGGGWSEFAYGTALQTRTFILADPAWTGGWPSVQARLATLAADVHAEGVFLLATLLIGLVTAGAWVTRPRRDGPSSAWLLAAWLLPGLAFYVLVYAGEPVNPDGYLMGLVPAAAIACALVLRGAWTAMGGPLVPKPLRVGGAFLIAGVCLLPAAWPAEWPDGLQAQRAGLAWGAQWTGMEAAFPPNETALLTFYGAPWVELEHPAYLAWQVQPFVTRDLAWSYQVVEGHGLNLSKAYFPNIRDGPDPPHPFPAWVKRVIVLEGHPMEGDVRIVRPSILLHQARLPSGALVQTFATTGLASIEDAVEWSTAEAP